MFEILTILVFRFQYFHISTAQVKGVELQLPLPSMTYADAMLRYGTDRPDTRYGLLLSDVTDAVAGCKLKCARLIRRPHA